MKQKIARAIMWLANLKFEHVFYPFVYAPFVFAFAWLGMWRELLWVLMTASGVVLSVIAIVLLIGGILNWAEKNA